MRQLKNIGLGLPIAGLVLFLFLTGYSGSAPDAAVSSITTNPAQFDGKRVSVRGAATTVRETTSRRGNEYATFQVQDAAGDAVKIFTWGHPSITDGDRVVVVGVFQQVRNVGRYTFYDELAAESVTRAATSN